MKSVENLKNLIAQKLWGSIVAVSLLLGTHEQHPTLTWSGCVARNSGSPSSILLKTGHNLVKNFWYVAGAQRLSIESRSSVAMFCLIFVSGDKISAERKGRQECWKCRTDCGITQLVLVDVDRLLHLGRPVKPSFYLSLLDLSSRLVSG
jgi:hypothetical protein